MVQLNHNIKIGDTVNISPHLSWQVADARISGNYMVTNIINNHAELARDGDGYSIEVDIDTLSYLTGSDIDNTPSCQAINPNEFQPSIDEEYEIDYLSEDHEELGFVYCGWRGCKRTVRMDLISHTWCYISLPW